MRNFYERYWQGSHYNELNDDYKNDFKYKWPVVKKLLSIKPKTILDFGCGNGVIIEKMMEIYPQSTFFGVDVSGNAIKMARKKNPGVKFFKVGDGDNIPIASNSIDFIFSGDTIEHVYDTEVLFNEFHRILKKGGKILITTPYHGLIKNLLIVLINFDLVFDPLGPHIRFFTKKSITSILTKFGFSINKFGYFGRFFPVSNAMYIMAQK